MSTSYTPAIPKEASFARFLGKGKIAFINKSVGSPGPGQLLLQNKANSLCGSDFAYLFNGNDTVSPGHEIAGVVAAAGPDTRIKPGTRGVVFLMDYCGKCRNCQQGATNQCLHKRADYGFTHDGGYGSYIVINENVFFPIPDSMSYAQGTLLLDIMGTGGHAIKRARLVHPSPASMIVLGAGPIGLGILAMAKIMYGKDFPVLISDVVEYRLDLAEKLGGLPINLNKGSLAEGAASQGFKEIDVAIDSSGKESARRAALDVLSQRGVLIFVGHGEKLQLQISPDMIATERALLGSEYFCYNELQGNLDLYLQNRDYLDQIITHTYPIAELEEAYRVFVGRDTGKVIAEY
ncbi:alcohol dehydrogenase catalytic domain-containing protein [Flavitalea sp. BT771]|uniref:alcohol dehydrogenase catalytic domain-containing protein n=1 Tax=Flavitalea sp. BT771 TaxID=3063329 RepID=UPI0026E436DB|nr:alcohol dehydrogenase catalytic domain-containing protein [Flavitalea sp. BT771]MDO6435437.1 alcohol dehydrogenase catalytic domain-containing protein [Flavitalea sp. BT771]MDV6224203.1 alcohol dehydrogenase catalytic domain-containing protein [Flavitalea sp. BT771]